MYMYELYVADKESSQTGSLNEYVQIIVASNITVCLLCSILFFIIGLICQHYCYCSKHKQPVVQHTTAPPQAREASPLYQEIQQNQAVDIQVNLAYIPVQLS